MKKKIYIATYTRLSDCSRVSAIIRAVDHKEANRRAARLRFLLIFMRGCGMLGMMFFVRPAEMVEVL